MNIQTIHYFFIMAFLWFFFYDCTPDFTKPGKIQNLRVTHKTNDSFTVAWDEPEDPDIFKISISHNNTISSIDPIGAKSVQIDKGIKEYTFTNLVQKEFEFVGFVRRRKIRVFVSALDEEEDESFSLEREIFVHAHEHLEIEEIVDSEFETNGNVRKLRITQIEPSTNNCGSKETMETGGLAVDEEENIYFSDITHHRIQKWNNNLKAMGFTPNRYYFLMPVRDIQRDPLGCLFIHSWGEMGTGEGKFNTPRGVAVDPDGDVYVADSGNHRIQKFNSRGEFILQWGQIGSDSGEFIEPDGVVVDPQGDIYVVDSGNHRIQKFNSRGEFILQWGSEGESDTEFMNPGGIAVDSKGDIYIVDIGNLRIQKFSPEGRYIRSWRELIRMLSDGSMRKEGFIRPTGIAIDKWGYIYVSDAEKNEILKFNSSGSLVYYNSGGNLMNETREIRDPMGIAVDQNEYIYILRFYNRMEIAEEYQITPFQEDTHYAVTKLSP